MKRKTKKVGVFVMIAVITMFTVVGMASADQHFPKALRGEYAVTQVLSNIFSIGGFNPDFTPKCFTPPSGSPVCMSSVMLAQRAGVFTFEKHGTGSATLNGSSITVSPPSAVTQTITFDFTYTVDKDGMITITQVPGTYLITYTSGPNSGQSAHLEGVLLTGPISPDGKNINLVGSNMRTVIIPGLPLVEPNNFSQSSTFLTWQDE
jgi:hypothetical protein